MPNRAILDFMGMVNYSPDIFDQFVVPEGVDRENVISRILFDTAELCLLIPEPHSLQWALGVWSASRLPVWTRINDAINLDYDPLETFTSTDKDYWTETGNGSDTRNSSGNRNGTSGTTINQPGFNSGEMVSTSATSGNSEEETQDQTDGSYDNHVEHIGDRSRSGREGTSGQTLVKESLEIADNNVIDVIVQEVKEKFCIMVY